MIFEQLTVRLPSVESASGYKVQYCLVDDGTVSDPNIDICGFAWSAVYPTAGVHLIKLYGLSNSKKYQIRVRAFFCDGPSIVGKTISIVTPKIEKLKRGVIKPAHATDTHNVQADQSKDQSKDQSNDQSNETSSLSTLILRTPNPTIKRISASRDTILLSWDGGCRIDANTLRAIKIRSISFKNGNSKSSSSSSNGLPNAGTSEQVCTDPSAANSLINNMNNINESGSSVQPVPVMWEVKYDRDEGMTWKGNWQTAGCVEARRVDNMNDDPFSCYINGLKEGRRYKFAVFGTMADGKTEIISKISRHMTACDDDADCYGEKICSPSFKCVAPQFSKSLAMWLIFVLAIGSLMAYVIVSKSSEGASIANGAL